MTVRILHTNNTELDLIDSNGVQYSLSWEVERLKQGVDLSKARLLQ